MNQTPLVLDLDKVLEEKAPKIYNKIPRFIINYLKRKVHIDELNEILRIYADKEGVDFMQAVVGYFNLKLDVYGLENIPQEGRFIFASNHPLGGLDGICLSAVVGERYDKRIKYVVNDVLYFIRNLQPIFLPVNKYGRQSKQATTTLNEAYESDDQIITFPAGLCSRKTKGAICDLPWQKNFIVKAIDSKRDIVPVYFNAKNSNFFYWFANIRKSLGIKFNIELILLPDEMFKNKNTNFSITFGEPIPYSRFDNTKNTSQWAEYVKNIAYNLAETKK
ncbi:1-acyl-sn-glycerol-3-phosphate acyltransferase [Dysgonomonas sp. Marseille-P4677]|uniref:1-acyl-sn-glycerol-3-phosphate acyltransferase n=1 Tax=Dysgonomonas sp. Marseille-P4677 TaxID=2364790 RepID=UPI001914C1D9|nr:1-acyl-sn-glycerol-3-phosphate acyltransferase [Dysgonomonas sp. Marseille-P4677]MBK5719354.1 1-acyl-sn-glycerol-3-phosphate acyltransferase [Dysgonomonas sp. Marseille-P4677]